MRRLLTVPVAVAVAASAAACVGDEDGDRRAGPAPKAGRDLASANRGPKAPWPRVASYRPEASETYRNGKQLASRAALRAVTYPRGITASEVAARIGRTSRARSELASVIEPVVMPDAASRGRIVYPQLSGVTESSLGAMVVVRQTLEGDEKRRQFTRVFDVRLRRSGGPWRLDRIASVGGRRAAPGMAPGEAEQSVLSNDRIRLSDSARWDILRGGVDPELLRAMQRLATRHSFAVSVIRSGHPPEVWATDRASAHSRGMAVDIYEVDGRLVTNQRDAGSPAYDAAASLVEAGADQVGSPWVLGPGGRRSFSDAVHQDHLHLQWSPRPTTAR